MSINNENPTGNHKAILTKIFKNNNHNRTNTF
jgi:hypothetical protein